MNGDTPNITDDEVIEAAEEAAVFARPSTGAVTPIRDAADEPFVFRFEVGPAILFQLLDKLRTLEIRPLADSMNAPHPGFYQLFLDGQPVYIGKTSRTVGERLGEHVKKLRGRVSLDRIGCRFAYVEDPSLVDMAEGALIKFFDARGEADWNRSGFGSKTTGYGRAGTRGANWDTEFPPDLNWQLRAGSDRPITLGALIRTIARQAPIPFSIPRTYSAAFNAVHTGTLNVPEATRTFRQWAHFVEHNLAAGWTIQREPRSWYIVPT